MDALLKKLDENGYEVVLHDDTNVRRRSRSIVTYVSVLEELVNFGLEEVVERISHIPAQTKKQTVRPQYEFRPTGKLTLCIKYYYSPNGRQLRWSDGKRRRIENCLNDFVGGLYDVALAKRAFRREKENDHQQEKIQQEHAAETARMREEDARRFQSLLEEVNCWRTSENIRAYIAAVQHRITEIHGGVPPNSELENWLAWAESKANDLDPLGPKK
jgi:hypothetical protein